MKPKSVFSSRIVGFSAGVSAIDVWPIIEHIAGGGDWQPEFTGQVVRAAVTLAAYTVLRLDTQDPVYTPHGWPGRDRPSDPPPQPYRAPSHPAERDRPAPAEADPTAYDEWGNYVDRP